MPTVDNRKDSITQNLFELDSSATAHFSSSHLQYAYFQTNFYTDTARQCNFNIVNID